MPVTKTMRKLPKEVKLQVDMHEACREEQGEERANANRVQVKITVPKDNDALEEPDEVDIASVVL